MNTKDYKASVKGLMVVIGIVGLLIGVLIFWQWLDFNIEETELVGTVESVEEVSVMRIWWMSVVRVGTNYDTVVVAEDNNIYTVRMTEEHDVGSEVRIVRRDFYVRGEVFGIDVGEYSG